MINIYGTIGDGCEDFRFKKIRHIWNGICIWQRVKKFLFFWVPVGETIKEHQCNYFLIDNEK